MIVEGLLAVAIIDGGVNMVRCRVWIGILEEKGEWWAAARSAPRRESAARDAEGANARADASIVATSTRRLRRMVALGPILLGPACHVRSHCKNRLILG